MKAKKKGPNKGMEDLLESLKSFEALMKEIGRKRMKHNDFKVVEFQYKALKEYIKNQTKD